MVKLIVTVCMPPLALVMHVLGHQVLWARLWVGVRLAETGQCCTVTKVRFSEMIAQCPVVGTLKKKVTG